MVGADQVKTAANAVQVSMQSIMTPESRWSRSGRCRPGENCCQCCTGKYAINYDT